MLAIRAMGTFDDPSILRKALDLAWTDEIKVSELRYLFGSALGRLASRPVLYAWEKENWARLRARLPPSFAGEILGDVIATICTPETRDDAREFVAHATKDMEGVKRRIDQAFEMAGLCIALREHGAAEVSRYMARK